MVRGLSIEERVRRIGVDQRPMLEARPVHGPVEGLADIRTDVGVGSTINGEDRGLDLGGDVGRGGRPAPGRARRPAIEPDEPIQAETERAGKECQPAAHAEAGHEQVGGCGVLRSKGPHCRDAGPDIRAEGRPPRLSDMRAEIEVVAAVAEARRAGEVIDRDRVDPVLGEAEGQLLVVGMQPADVGEDQDARARRPRGPGGERPERRPVGRGEGHRRPIHRTTRDRGDGRPTVEIEAHVVIPCGQALVEASGARAVVNDTISEVICRPRLA